MKTKLIISGESPKYPRLMKATGYTDVVLFTKNNTGTVIHTESTDPNRLGEYCRSWNMDGFEPLPAGTKIIVET